jgi:hypothetical protein
MQNGIKGPWCELNRPHQKSVVLGWTCSITFVKEYIIYMDKDETHLNQLPKSKLFKHQVNISKTILIQLFQCL